MRIEVIHNIPSPYRIHLFTEMHRQLLDRNIEFHVNFMSQGDPGRPREWLNPKMPFPFTYWNDYGYGCHHFNPGMIRFLLKSKPEIVIIGSVFDTFTSIVLCHLLRSSTKCAWVEGQTKTPGRMSGLIGWIKRDLLSHCLYVAVPGIEGIRYIEMHQGLTRRKLASPVLLPNIVDETRFRPRELWDSCEIQSVRQQLLKNECNKKICLVPARLEPVKGVLPFVRNLDEKLLKGWKVIIIGNGSEHDVIQATIDKANLSSVIELKDFVSYSEMPKYYAAADLFLLPSVRDQNPLSVVEALHTGLPVAITDQAGNVDEAVQDGVNGWQIPVLDSQGYKKCLQRVFSSNSQELKCMGKNSLVNHASFWNTQKCVRHFLDSIIG